MTGRFPFDRTWDLDRAVELACLLEASAPKLGNVHPQASFADMEFAHFLASAAAIQSTFAHAGELRVGQLVLRSASLTRAQVGVNTNLGTLLLVAPLARAYARYPEQPWNQSVRIILSQLHEDDSHDIYEAIRISQPGGLGRQSANDVHASPPQDLIQAMAQVADFDAVARQYVNNFADVLGRLLNWFNEELESGHNVLEAICRLQTRQLAHEPDGLILRKCGPESARQVQNQSAALWQKLRHHSAPVTQLPEYQELDQFLRLPANAKELPTASKGNARNPGTTADLIAATLMVRLVASGPTS